MSTLRPSPTPATAAVPRPSRIEQIYVTHCTPDDLVVVDAGGAGRRAGGFGVRASSTKDPALLGF